MEEDDWLLVFKIHDGFESEFLGEGLKVAKPIPLKQKYLYNAKMEANDIWKKIKDGEVNPPRRVKTSKGSPEDWGHYDPHIVSKNNPQRKEKLT